MNCGDASERPSAEDIARDIGTLVASVEEFNRRFGRSHPAFPRELAARIPVIQEELDELRAEIVAENEVEVARAVIDVLFAVVGTALRVEPRRLREAIQAVIDKNDAKTPETYAVNEHQKIVKKATVSS